MKTHRKLILIGGLLAALAAAQPASTSASSLLSGYGGPGQGNQAILGSALVNGPRGGGGGAGAGGGAQGGESSAAATSGETGGEGSASSAAPAAPGGSGGSGGAGGAGAPGGHSRATGSASHATSGGPGVDRRRRAALAASFYPASETIPADQQSGTLGLTGGDLVLIIVGAGALVFVGVLTRRLAQGQRPGTDAGQGAGG